MAKWGEAEGGERRPGGRIVTCAFSNVIGRSAWQLESRARRTESHCQSSPAVFHHVPFPPPFTLTFLSFPASSLPSPLRSSLTFLGPYAGQLAPGSVSCVSKRCSAKRSWILSHNQTKRTSMAKIICPILPLVSPSDASNPRASASSLNAMYCGHIRQRYAHHFTLVFPVLISLAEAVHFPMSAVQPPVIFISSVCGMLGLGSHLSSRSPQHPRHELYIWTPQS